MEFLIIFDLPFQKFVGLTLVVSEKAGKKMGYVEQNVYAVPMWGKKKGRKESLRRKVRIWCDVSDLPQNRPVTPFVFGSFAWIATQMESAWQNAQEIPEIKQEGKRGGVRESKSRHGIRCPTSAAGRLRPSSRLWRSG